MSDFAKRTEVPVERSRNEIERMLARYGAGSFIYGVTPERAVIGFTAHDRQVKFTLPLPQREKMRSQAAFEQEHRRRWRALALVLKAKLEAVATGIVTFEQEFLAHVVLPDGQTVGDAMRPQIAAAYTSGTMPPLLPYTPPPP